MGLRNFSLGKDKTGKSGRRKDGKSGRRKVGKTESRKVGKMESRKTCGVEYRTDFWCKPATVIVQRQLSYSLPDFPSFFVLRTSDFVLILTFRKSSNDALFIVCPFFFNTAGFLQADEKEERNGDQ